MTGQEALNVVPGRNENDPPVGSSWRDDDTIETDNRSMQRIQAENCQSEDGRRWSDTHLVYVEGDVSQDVAEASLRSPKRQKS